MSLRTRVLILFLTLAVAPLVVVAAFDYFQSVQALSGLVQAQNANVAGLAGRELERQLARRQDDLGILADNLATPQALSSATAEPAWERVAGVFSSWLLDAELRDRDGRLAARYANRSPRPVSGACSAEQESVPLTHAVLNVRGDTIGTILAHARPDEIFPVDALAARVGAAGVVAVVDRATGHVLYQARCDVSARTVAALAFDPARPDAGAIDLTRAGSHADGPAGRVAAVVPLDAPAWSVVSIADLGEFVLPFRRSRAVFVLLVLFVAGATAVAFWLLLGRITRSLNDLAEAADEVGRGNLTPPLPPPAADEVGRLAFAFGLMTDKVQETLRQIESTRQLATMGEFAAKVSHEIRNPLSSIRLNLQGIEREVRKGRVPRDLEEPVSTCLREIDRLDQVVRGILSLAREQPLRRRPCSVHALIEDAAGLLDPQLRGQSIALACGLHAGRDTVVGDETQLRATVLNLVLNAADVMPDGGTIRLHTDNGEGGSDTGVVRIHIADEGPGVASDMREEIFRPFMTTKSSGTGLGLPIARRTAERHGGALYLAPRSPLERGAEFVLVLPAAEIDADGAVDATSPASNTELVRL